MKRRTYPLFVPLMAIYWFKFADGSKRTEYRLLRGGWNRSTVWTGRRVIFSKGYNGARLRGVITRVRTCAVRDVPHIKTVYPFAKAADPVIAFSV
ncbi:hypothetical protein EBT31_22055, partial [bacterium]|nr:hypothetical protein [bacterium]